MTATFVLVALSALCLPAPSAGTACFSSARPILECSDHEGLCRYDEYEGEELVIPDRSGLIEDFWQSCHGNVVAVLRGHLAPGSIVVFDREGQVLLSNRLQAREPLRKLVGQDDDGRIAVCTGNSYFFFACSTLLALDGDVATTVSPWPSGCGFPRTIGDRALCLQAVGVDTSETIVIEAGSETRTVVSLPIGEVRDFVPLETELLFRTSSSLLRWRDGELETLASDVLWTSTFEDGVVLGRCDLSADEIGPCEVLRYRVADRLAVVWSSEDLVPVRGATADGGLFLVLQDENEDRRVLRVNTGGEDSLARLVMVASQRFSSRIDWR